jgi:hypothetical protein
MLSQVPKSEGPGAPRFLYGEVGHPPKIEYHYIPGAGR